MAKEGDQGGLSTEAVEAPLGEGAPATTNEGTDTQQPRAGITDPPAAEGASGDEREVEFGGNGEAAALDPAVEALLGTVGMTEQDYRDLELAWGADKALSWLDKSVTAKMNAALEGEEPAEETTPEPKPKAAPAAKAPAGTPAKKAAAAATPPAEGEETQAEVDEVVEEIRKEYGDVLATKIAAPLRALAKQHDELKARLDDMGGYVNQQRTEVVRKGFDAAVAAMTKGNDAFAKQVKGLIGDKWDRTTAGKRQQLMDRAIQIGEITRARTGASIPAHVALRRAAEEVLSQPIAPADAIKNVRAQVQARNNIRQVPPSAGRASTGGGGAPQGDGLDQARAHVRGLLQRAKAG